jgi:hypothetical protein
MEDFFPFLQNPADTDFISEPICHRRRAKATMGGPSSQLPFELSNEYIKRALPQRLGPVVSQNCKFKRLDSHERLFVLPCY